MELVRLLKIVINLCLAALASLSIGYLFDLELIGYIAALGIAFAILTIFQPIVDKVFLRL